MNDVPLAAALAKTNTPLDERSASPLDQALARLSHSRQNLREALSPAPTAEGENLGLPLLAWRRARAWLRSTSWGALLDPLLSALGPELTRWWQGQRWYPSWQLAKQTFAAELEPVVRRYPIASVLLTAAAAAIVASSGVWRWRSLRRSAWTLGAGLRRTVFDQLRSPAVQGVLLSALVTFLAARSTAAPGPTANAADAANAAGSESG